MCQSDIYSVDQYQIEQYKLQLLNIKIKIKQRMQKKRNLSNRLQTQKLVDETSRSVDKKQNMQSASEQKMIQKVCTSQRENQLQKYKFAKQYAKLTKQFEKILNKNNSHHRRYHSTSQQKKFFAANSKIESHRDIHVSKDNADKNTINKQGEQSEKKVESLGKTQIKNPKLQNLYNNKLHHQILETASKIKKNQNKQKYVTVSMLPTSVHQISPNSPLAQFSPQYFANSSSKTKPEVDNQIIVLLEQQKAQKINKNFYYFSETLAHFHNIYKIMELLDNYKNNYSLMIKNIKKYIMNNNKADITKLQQLLKIPQQKQKLKLFLCLQKIAILGILDAIIRQNQLCAKNDGKIVLQTVMGVYSSIFSYIIEQKLYLNTETSIKKPLNLKKTGDFQTQPQTQSNKQIYKSLILCLNLLQSQQIQPRKDLQSSIQFLYKKLQNLFKPNLQLFHKIKQSLVTIAKVTFNGNTLIGNFGNNSRMTNTQQYSRDIGSMKTNFKHNNKTSTGIVNINKFFYFLLCEYAHHMNCSENIEILKVHKNLLDFFLTCPSPHLTYSFQQDKITVVLQFESTIAMVKSYNFNNSNKISIKLRPHALQMLRQISKVCEIVLMTTLMPENIPLSKPKVPTSKSSTNILKKNLRQEQSEFQYEQAFKLATSVLFRYHYVRYRGLLVKDITRLGRRTEKIILIDSIDSEAYTNSQPSGLPAWHKQQKVETSQTYAHSYIEKTNYSSNSQNITHLSQHLNINIQNTIPITTWKGSGKDQQLMYLKELLMRIVGQDPQDVRQLLKKYKLLIYGDEKSGKRDKQSQKVEQRHNEQLDNQIQGNQLEINQEQMQNEKYKTPGKVKNSQNIGSSQMRLQEKGNKQF